MLLTITNASPPAADLGYLLHKNPQAVHSAELSFGRAHVFFPDAAPHLCTAALLLEVDPIGLVRRRDQTPALDQYVNDRPYVASSFMSVAMAELFRSALNGRSKERPELVDTALSLRARVACVPCRAGEPLLRQLFEPLGYKTGVVHHALDDRFPEWGPSRYFTLDLEASVRLRDLLAHLYVLLPVLDDEKHYWVGEDEVAKLVRRGEGWLATHPARDQIASRYLKHRRALAREALAALTRDEGEDPEESAAAHAGEEAAVESPIRLNEHRLGTVIAVLKNLGAKRVLDLGCGEGKLLRRLMDDRDFTLLAGMDVSHRALGIASDKAGLARLPDSQRDRIRLFQGSLTYRDARLQGYDAATVIEVIEHLDPHRLEAFERVLFDCARPSAVVVTTPNAEYNATFENMPAGGRRHRDHRFEWSRSEFQLWAQGVGSRRGYSVRFLPVGPEHAVHGPPTQMAVFRK